MVNGGTEAEVWTPELYNALSQGLWTKDTTKSKSDTLSANRNAENQHVGEVVKTPGTWRSNVTKHHPEFSASHLDQKPHFELK